MALLDVQDLAVSFVTRNGTNKAVDGVSFSVELGRITAIIGESGSGKSVACYSLLGLVPMPPGRIDGGRALFEDRDLLQMEESELRKIRGRDIAMIFQDPMTSLNPYLRIDRQMVEVLMHHRGMNKADAQAQAVEMLRAVRIPDPERRIRQYPHEFSGGMRQRVMVAMGCVVCLRCHEGKCAFGIGTQDPERRKKLDIEAAAQRVANYIEGMTCEATLLAKAAGKTALANMEREDLRAMTLEACAMTGIPLLGNNYTFGEAFGFF